MDPTYITCERVLGRRDCKSDDGSFRCRLWWHFVHCSFINRRNHMDSKDVTYEHELAIRDVWFWDDDHLDKRLTRSRYFRPIVPA